MFENMTIISHNNKLKNVDKYLTFKSTLNVFIILLLIVIDVLIILISEMYRHFDRKEILGVNGRTERHIQVPGLRPPPLSTEGIKSPALSLFIRDLVYLTPVSPIFLWSMSRSQFSFLRFWIIVLHRKKKTFPECAVVQINLFTNSFPNPTPGRGWIGAHPQKHGLPLMSHPQGKH